MRRENSLAYISLAVIVLIGAFFRLVDLSEPGFVVDEIGFTTNGMSFIQFGNFEAYYDHPPLGKYFLGASALAFGLSEFSARLPVAVSGILTILATFLVARRLYDRRTGLVASLLTSVSIYDIAYSRVALLDGVLALFYMLAMLLFVGSSERKWGWLYGVPIGLAIATKLSGIYLYPIVIGYLMVFEHSVTYNSGSLNIRIWKNHILAFGASILSFFLVWPAAMQPSSFSSRIGEVPLFFKTFYFDAQYLREGLTTFFMGQISNNPPPWFYLVFLFSKLTIPYLVLASIGILVALVRRSRSDVLLLLWFLLPLLLFSFQSVKQLRYLAPILPPVSILAGRGVLEVYRISKQAMSKYLKTGFVLLLVWQIALVVNAHPDYLLYYNEIAGGPTGASRIFMVGHGEGLREAAEYLEARAKRGDSVLSSWHQDILEFYSDLHYIQMPKTLREFSAYDNPRWAVVYLTQVQRKLPSAEVIDLFADRQPEEIIYVRGVPLVRIYNLADK